MPPLPRSDTTRAGSRVHPSRRRKHDPAQRRQSADPAQTYERGASAHVVMPEASRRILRSDDIVLGAARRVCSANLREHEKDGSDMSDVRLCGQATFQRRLASGVSDQLCKFLPGGTEDGLRGRDLRRSVGHAALQLVGCWSLTKAGRKTLALLVKIAAPPPTSFDFRRVPYNRSDFRPVLRIPFASNELSSEVQRRPTRPTELGGIFGGMNGK